MRSLRRFLLLIAFDALACGGDRPPASQPETPTEPDHDELAAQRAHCEAYDRDRTACEADPKCMTMFRPGRSGNYSFGGPTVCVACLDMVALRGSPREVCRLRAEGRMVEACRLLFPNRPERCQPRAADAGVSPSP